MAKRETKAQAKERERSEACAALKNIIKPGSTVYTMVTHVARSGMMRHVRVLVAHEGAIVDVTSTVGLATGIPVCVRHYRAALKRSGCGMDLAWDTVHRLGRSLFPEGGPLEFSPREAQERRAGEKIERDGGYLLRHSHL